MKNRVTAGRHARRQHVVVVAFGIVTAGLCGLVLALYLLAEATGAIAVRS